MYLRTVLERTQPIDRKLKYQVDKLVKLASSGGAAEVNAEGDLLQYRPDPANLVPKVRIREMLLPELHVPAINGSLAIA